MDKNCNHYFKLTSAQGTYAHDVTCPKDSHHGYRVTEGHIMPTCIKCGFVSPTASKNSLNTSVWSTEDDGSILRKTI